MVKLDNAVDYSQLMLGRFVVRIYFQGLLELVPSAPIVSIVSENEAPHDPVVGVFDSFGELLDAFLDFLNCPGHLAALKQGESPVSVAGSKICGMELRLAADAYRLLVELMKIE